MASFNVVHIQKFATVRFLEMTGILCDCFIQDFLAAILSSGPGQIGIAFPGHSINSKYFHCSNSLICIGILQVELNLCKPGMEDQGLVSMVVILS